MSRSSLVTPLLCVLHLHACLWAGTDVAQGRRKDLTLFNDPSSVLAFHVCCLCTDCEDVKGEGAQSQLDPNTAGDTLHAGHGNSCRQHCHMAPERAIASWQHLWLSCGTGKARTTWSPCSWSSSTPLWSRQGSCTDQASSMQTAYVPAVGDQALGGCILPYSMSAVLHWWHLRHEWHLLKVSV